MTVANDLSDLLKQSPSTVEAVRTVELFGMVRAGQTDQTFGLSIGSCDVWVELPLSSVHSMHNHGSRRCRDHVHHFVKLELQSPAHENPWFDVLAVVLSRAQGAGAALGNSQGGMAAAGGIVSPRRLSYMSCFECWIRGGEPDFCWGIGACN